MTTIPKDITIPLEEFQRAALKTLMANAPPNYKLADLVQLVLSKGLQAMLVGRDLPEVTRMLARRGERNPREDDHLFRSPRVSANYIGFPIDWEQQRDLDHLLTEHQHLSEEEMCRIVLDFGLRAMKTVPFANTVLANTKRTQTTDAGGKP